MTARQSREATLAVAHQQRTGCTPAEAAKRYGVAVTTVRRALARLGVAARPVGRPPIDRG
jgi:transposase